MAAYKVFHIVLLVIVLLHTVVLLLTVHAMVSLINGKGSILDDSTSPGWQNIPAPALNDSRVLDALPPLNPKFAMLLRPYLQKKPARHDFFFNIALSGWRARFSNNNHRIPQVFLHGRKSQLSCCRSKILKGFAVDLPLWFGHFHKMDIVQMAFMVAPTLQCGWGNCNR